MINEPLKSEVHQQTRLHTASETLERNRLNNVINSYKTVQTAKDIELQKYKFLLNKSLMVNCGLFVVVVVLLIRDWF